MKKSDITRIIREEVIQLIKEQYLTEAFADPKLAMINKLGGLDRRWGENFWNAAAKTYDLAWDKLPKGTLQKMTPLNPLALKDGMMTFWVVKTSKPNIFLGFVVKSEIKSINSIPDSLTSTLFTTPKADSKPIIQNDAQSKVVTLSSNVWGA